ncbi:MAG: inositol monophosphatase [Clostridia bacterium]|nr:inositol monophosphatase [Clostridia bacterium]
MQMLLDGIVGIIKEGGEILLSAASLHAKGFAKGGHANYVTEYDSKIQNFLIDRLSKLLPEANFIGEENGLSAFQENDRTGYAFVIDPIDGTNNFMKGYEPSMISIALLKDGSPYIGVIYNPFQKQVFSAIRGHGAFVNNTPIHSSEEPLESSLVSVGTAPYNPELHATTFDLASLYLRYGMDLRRSGTAAWDLCAVACGKTGLFFEPVLGLWDFAAGALICEEAGCTITDLDGKPLTYDKSSSILCASAGVSRGTYLPSDLKKQSV